MIDTFKEIRSTKPIFLFLLAYWIYIDGVDTIIRMAINYGLTLGIHSRIDKVIDTVIKNTNVGNTYINRNIVGAVVGSQPFGGHHKSGTGPKAGGPEYLKKFCYEYSVSNNII